MENEIPMMWDSAVILPDSNGGWSWAEERLLGLPVLERLLITLHRCGIERVLIPSSGAGLKSTIDGRLNGRKRPQLLWGGASGSQDFFAASPVLWIQGGFLFDIHFVRWFSRGVQSASQGQALARTEQEHPVAASVASDGWSMRELDGTSLQELCEKKRTQSLSIPPGRLCRSIPFLKAPGSDRSLLLSAEKPSDRWHVRWVRNWSFPLLRLLAERGVDPNSVTWLGFGAGLLGCFFLLMQGYGWGILGAFSLYFSWVLDCVDGTLARLTFSESARGRRLDTLLGHLINMAVFCSLVWRVYGHESLAKAGLLSILFVGSIMLAHRVSQTERRLRPVSGSEVRRRLQTFLDKINHRDSAVWIILFSLVDGFEFLLWGSLIGLQVFWLLHFSLILRHRRHPGVPIGSV